MQAGREKERERESAREREREKDKESVWREGRREGGGYGRMHVQAS